MNPPSQDRPRGLGRGLSALIGDEVAAVKGEPVNKKDTRTLPIAFLTPGRYQPRETFDQEPLANLAASIKEVGVLSPILVRPIGPDRYEIVAGERRWRAAQMAKLHDVPVVIREMPDGEALEIAIIENIQRADLNALEEAAAYQQLMAAPFNQTQEQVATQVGKSRSHVANTVRLMKLPPQVQAWLREGKLTAGHARTLLGVTDPEAVARALIEGGLNVRQAEQKSSEQRSVKKPKVSGKPYKDPNVSDMESSISSILGVKVEILHRGDRGGEIRIRYKTLEQLEDVEKRLKR